MEFKSIVSLPAGAKTRFNPDFVRPSEEGDISCYVNPTKELVFQYLNPREQLKGMVTGINSNNPDKTERLLTDVQEILIPNEFFFKNGLVCLNIKDNGVEYYYWDSVTEDYVYLNTFSIGHIDFLKARVINSNVIQIQINDTIWTLRQGKPFVYVQHAQTPIRYGLKENYVHDGQTRNLPSKNEDISVSTNFYCNIYNSTDQYRMLLVKTSPTSIKSDSIPADDITIIGHYDKNASSDYNKSISISKECFIQISQYIKPLEVGL